MESELPEWALMALEKRARLLERSLSDQNARNLLELDSDSDAIVMKEIDEARGGMGTPRMMPPPSVPKVRPNYRIAPKPVQPQQAPAQPTVQQNTVSPGMSSSATPVQSNPMPQMTRNQNQPHQNSGFSQPPSNNSFQASNSNNMGMMNINPFMFNPYIYPAHGYFNDTSQYEEFLKVQEEQLRIARQHFKLALSGSQNPHNPSSMFMNSSQAPQFTNHQVHPQNSFQNAYPASIFPQPQNFHQQPPPSPYYPQQRPQPLPLELQSQQSQVSTIRANENLERQSVQSEAPSTIALHYPPKPQVRQPPPSYASRQPNRIQSQESQNFAENHQKTTQAQEQPVYQADPMSVESEKIDKNNALAMFKRLESQQGPNSTPNYARQNSGSYLRHVKTLPTQQKAPSYVQTKPQVQPQNNNTTAPPLEKKSILKKQSAYEPKPPAPVEPQVIRAQPEVIRQSAPPQKNAQGPVQSELESDKQDQLAGVSIAKTASMFGERTRTKIPTNSNSAPKREMTPPRSLSPPREATPPREESPAPARAVLRDPSPEIVKEPSPEVIPQVKQSQMPAAQDFESASESDGPEYFSEEEEEQIARIIAPTHSPVKAAPVLQQQERPPSPEPESSKEPTPEPKKMKTVENRNPPLAFDESDGDNSDISDPEIQQEDEFDLLGDTIKEHASNHVPKARPEDYPESSDESVDIDGTTVPVSRIDENENISMQSPRKNDQEIKDLEKLENSLGDLHNKADAAYALIEKSKSTVEVNPTTSEVKSADPKEITSARAKKAPKKAPKQEASAPATTVDEDEAKWAEENRLLEEQIAAAKAILAKASPNTKPVGSLGAPEKPDRNGLSNGQPPKPAGRKKRVSPPTNGVTVNPDRTNSQYSRDQDGNFIPPREGYVNDVIVEGQVVIKSSILVTDKENRKQSFGKVGFNKEAKELTYPSMDQAIEDYDEEHARGDPPSNSNEAAYYDALTV
ncbi:Oidioi.mRNA.OKI2018_I69.chr1.g1786.t1.cds [Oikopleura dioica]|uniref:Oidioi.mRNA.OKI2018_I69.chr1.g1786.t1.cds n=1 Tax=Oikopleura dioica TaxID=34765 RepID=A0ABN7SY54_OIKDI|nr:Oidioi.mRNA.OKI2018_I69.chr1.g1786.t1.cds [Oikopleura dioica]